MNNLFFGDNLDVLREKIKDESVDLVYLDPPFNSAANYNVLFKAAGGQQSEAQAEAFRDTWGWGESASASYDDVMRANGDVALVLSGFRKWLGENAMMAYLAMMAARLIEMRRVLKPSGSIYLHCDPTASHYLKLILDAAFGHECFLSEVIWKRTSSHSSAKRWGPVHDSILFYSKGREFNWNPVYEQYDEAYIEKFYRNKDAGGRYQVDNLTGAGKRGGDSGKPWRNADPDSRGRHWAVPISLLNRLGFAEQIKDLTVQEKLEFLESKGLIAWPKSGEGMPRLKRYLKNQQGVAIQDVVTDISALSSKAQERIGYPTQKPRALLDRILSASSNPGDVVLDPFCGCGTTIESAEELKRNWIGIDVTHYAITLIERRLRKLGVSEKSYSILGRPTVLREAQELARRDKYQFQWWASWRLGAQVYSEEKRGADRGIDGNIFYHNGPYGTGRIIVSVKGGENVGVQMVRDLRGVIEREEAEMGILITLAEPTGPMRTEADGSGYVRKSAHGRIPRIQIVTVEEMLDGRMPKLPPLPQPVQKISTARRKEFPDQLELLLPFEGGAIVPAAGSFIDPRFDTRLIAAE